MLDPSLIVTCLAAVLQIGFAYACGIIFGFAASFGTSGAHFNPCVTACFVVYRDFPKLRAVRYVFFLLIDVLVGNLVTVGI
jgi:glycerol uptake facilitator-like aquaporin